MVILGGWAFLMSEVPLYAARWQKCSVGSLDPAGCVGAALAQGYLTYKNTHPLRTLP